MNRVASHRNLRAATGTVLMVYVSLHLLNHALGLVSTGTADSVRSVLHAIWNSWPGSALLYGSLGLHIGLAFVALWERRSLRMPAIEGARIVLGLAIPLLLLSHIVATRLTSTLYHVPLSYPRIVQALSRPRDEAFQLALVIAAWTHGCIGLHLMLVSRAAYAKRYHVAFAVAILLPTLAVLGFVSMARELASRGGPQPLLPTPDQFAHTAAIAARLLCAYAAMVLMFIAARALRQHATSRRADLLSLTYPNTVLKVPRGWSVLEASRFAGIAHMSMCGGRARCSTCRVRIVGPVCSIPPPSAEEARSLARVNAPPDVRLACQLRPTGNLVVTPLFQPRSSSAFRRMSREREVAVLFVDLRRWSGLSERQWPHDLVYVLDRYFAIVGEAVRECGGVPNQFIGDSVMAIFGLETALPLACRQAFDAARTVNARIAEWAASFEQDFGQALEIGMGLHAGTAIVTEVGYLDTSTVTAVGEIVNTASRLQDHTKAAQAYLVASLDSARLAGVDLEGAHQITIDVRGRSTAMAVVCFRHR